MADLTPSRVPANLAPWQLGYGGILRHLGELFNICNENMEFTDDYQYRGHIVMHIAHHSLLDGVDSVHDRNSSCAWMHCFSLLI